MPVFSTQLLQPFQGCGFSWCRWTQGSPLARSTLGYMTESFQDSGGGVATARMCPFAMRRPSPVALRGGVRTHRPTGRRATDPIVVGRGVLTAPACPFAMRGPSSVAPRGGVRTHRPTGRSATDLNVVGRGVLTAPACPFAMRGPSPVAHHGGVRTHRPTCRSATDLNVVGRGVLTAPVDWAFSFCFKGGGFPA